MGGSGGGKRVLPPTRRSTTRLGLQRIVPLLTQQHGGLAMFYSTERILELRSGQKNIKSLYDAAAEKENCGVGLIASLKSVPTRNIVERADEMLVRMAHRGGCGCDPASGDGSGE